MDSCPWCLRTDVLQVHGLMSEHGYKVVRSYVAWGGYRTGASCKASRHWKRLEDSPVGIMHRYRECDREIGLILTHMGKVERGDDEGTFTHQMKASTGEKLGLRLISGDGRLYGSYVMNMADWLRFIEDPRHRMEGSWEERKAQVLKGLQGEIDDEVETQTLILRLLRKHYWGMAADYLNDSGLEGFDPEAKEALENDFKLFERMRDGGAPMPDPPGQGPERAQPGEKRPPVIDRVIAMADQFQCPYQVAEDGRGVNIDCGLGILFTIERHPRREDLRVRIQDLDGTIIRDDVLDGPAAVVKRIEKACEVLGVMKRSGKISSPELYLIRIENYDKQVLHQFWSRSQKEAAEMIKVWLRGQDIEDADDFRAAIRGEGRKRIELEVKVFDVIRRYHDVVSLWDVFDKGVLNH